MGRYGGKGQAGGKDRLSRSWRGRDCRGRQVRAEKPGEGARRCAGTATARQPARGWRTSNQLVAGPSPQGPLAPLVPLAGRWLAGAAGGVWVERSARPSHPFSPIPGSTGRKTGGAASSSSSIDVHRLVCVRFRPGWSPGLPLRLRLCVCLRLRLVVVVLGRGLPRRVLEHRRLQPALVHLPRRRVFEAQRDLVPFRGGRRAVPLEPGEGIVSATRAARKINGQARKPTLTRFFLNVSLPE